jgi:hypothetical protein
MRRCSTLTTLCMWLSQLASCSTLTNMCVWSSQLASCSTLTNMCVWSSQLASCSTLTNMCMWLSQSASCSTLLNMCMWSSRSASPWEGWLESVGETSLRCVRRGSDRCGPGYSGSCVLRDGSSVRLLSLQRNRDASLLLSWLKIG